MLSRRTTWPESHNRLAQRIARRRSLGEPTLDLTGSKPTEGDLAFPSEALKAALAIPGAERYRPDPWGMLSAREAVSRWLCRDPRVRIGADRILLTASTI